MRIELNIKLSKIFKDLAAIYSFDDGGNPFRANAYEQAYLFLKGFGKDISEFSVAEMEEFEGIGKSIALKIKEYLDTGAIEKYEELRTTYPLELIRLSFLRGIGTKTLKKIHDELGVDTPEAFEDALRDGRVGALPGFGQKKVDTMLEGLEYYKENYKE